MERELRGLNLKIIEKRQKLSMLKSKVNTLELEIENLENELQNNGLLNCDFILFIINRKKLEQNKEKIKVKYEVRKIKNLIADKEIKMMQLKSDLNNKENNFTAKFKANFITFAICFFVILFKGFMIQLFFEHSFFEFLFLYFFIF